MGKYISLLLGLILGLSVTQPLLAQGVTTATIQGTVKDPNGMELIGATVVARHEPTGANYGVVTNVEGKFVLSNVRVGGPYTITISYLGYNTFILSDVTLQLGQKANFDFVLQETDEQLETVEVIAQSVQEFDPSQTGAITNVSTQQIQSMPTLDRSLNDIARLTPQAIETEDGGISFGGQNNRYNSIMIDGAIYNDVFGLNANGTPGGRTGAQPISLDAIAEVQIAVSPYDVQQSGFTGAAINAITRSGSNTVEGSAYVFHESENLAGKSLVLEDGQRAEQLNQFTETTYGARVGGPIIKDKLFYFLSLEARDEETSYFPNGLPLLSLDTDDPEQLLAAQAQRDTLNEFVTILKDVYGYDPGSFGPGNSSQPRNRKIFARFDYNISERHKLLARYNFTDGFTNTIFRSNSNYSFDNSEADISNTGHSIVAELQSNFGKGMSNELRVSYNNVYDERSPSNTDQLFPQIIYSNASSGLGPNAIVGGGRYDVLNSLSQKSVELTDNFRFLKGNHSILLGTRNEFFYFKNLFIESGFGEWTFNNLTDLREGRPTALRKFYSTDPNDFEKKAEWGALQFGAYIQDDWAVNENLSLTLGLRADLPMIIDEVSRNYTFEESFGRRNDLTPQRNLLISPRLGFNYNLFGKDQTVIRGGTGIFSGRVPFVWLSNQYSRSGVDFATLDIRTQEEINDRILNGLSEQERIDRIRDYSYRPNFSNQEERFEINLTNPNLRLPQEWRTTLGIDQKLPYGILGSIDYMYSETLYNIFYSNLNLLGVVGQDDKGRNLYGEAPNQPYYVDSENFTDVYVVENTTKGYQYSITTTLKKSAKNLFAQLSYTYAQGKEVGNNGNSIAGGNWANVPIVQNPNSPELAYSDYNRPHRIVGNLSYTKDWKDHVGTTFGIYFNAQSGRRYSYVYRGDANFDTYDARDERDLIYVPNSIPDPTASGLALEDWVDQVLEEEIIFSGSAEEAYDQWLQLNNLIESTPYLASRRGQFAERNGAVGKWNTRLDLTVKQRLGLDINNKMHNFEVSAVLVNAANLLGTIVDQPWGKQYNTFSTYAPLVVQGFDDEKNDLILAYRNISESSQTSRFGSVWRVQLGLRYSF